MSKPLKAFLIYSNADREFRNDLEKHIRPLVDLEYLNIWNDKEIKPGDYWDDAIKEQLLNADIFILLISIDYYNSEYIRGREFKIAVEKLRTESSIMIPIIVRDCTWKQFPIIKDLQVLPPEGIPVSDLEHWKYNDRVWRIIVEKIAIRIEELITTRAEVEKRNFEDKRLALQKQLLESHQHEIEKIPFDKKEQNYVQITLKLMRLRKEMVQLDRKKRTIQIDMQKLENEIAELEKMFQE